MMSNAVLKTTAQILSHGTVGRNNVAGPGGTEADDEGSSDHEKAYRNHQLVEYRPFILWGMVFL